MPLNLGRHDAARRQAVGFADPGFACEPGMIGSADRTPGASKEHGTALEALVIGLDARRDRTPGLRAFDHDHPHLRLSLDFFVDVILDVIVGRYARRQTPIKDRPVGDIASSRCSVWDLGGCTCPSFRARGHSWDGRSPTGRIPSLKEFCVATGGRFSWPAAERSRRAF